MSGTTSPSTIFAVVLGVAVAGGAAFALLRPASTPTEVTSATAPTDSAPENAPGSAQENGMGANDLVMPPHGGDPGAMGGGPAAPGSAAEDDEPELAWKVPAAWKTVPNPSSMRLATYRVPRALGDSDDADVSVTRAGGGVDANVDRWIGQFDGKPDSKRASRSVHGVKVTEVEVSGTYKGGGPMMAGAGGAGDGAKTGWTLLGAIVEGPGTPYFFKLTGPSASVKGARPAFDAMLDGVAPAAPATAPSAPPK